MSDSDASNEYLDEKPKVTQGCKTDKKPGKKSAGATIKAQVIRQKPSKIPATGSTNAAMGPKVAQHAFTLLTGEEFDKLALALGVDKVRLKDSWRKRWLPRIQKTLEKEFVGQAGEGGDA